VVESISPIQGPGLHYDRAAERWQELAVDQEEVVELRLLRAEGQGEGAAELIKSEPVAALEEEEEICWLLVAVQQAKAGCHAKRQLQV
jgi:hypothetical protein